MSDRSVIRHQAAAELRAFFTTDPAAIAAARQSRTAHQEFRRLRLRPALAELGCERVWARYVQATYAGPMQIGGLQIKPGGQIPAGWVADAKGGVVLRPAPGVAGRSAWLWLANIQPEPDTDTCYVLKAYGLAYRGRMSDGRSVIPRLVLTGEKLWAAYYGNPIADDPSEPPVMTWTEASADEYRMARNAHRTMSSPGPDTQNAEAGR